MRTTLTLCSTESVTCVPRRNRLPLPPGLCVGHSPDNCLAARRTCARKRDGKNLGWRSRLTQRLCKASFAASRAGGGLHSNGDSAQSRLEVLQKHSYILS